MNHFQPKPELDWAEANQRDLMSALDNLRQCLTSHCDTESSSISKDTDSPDYALGALCRLFGLSSFERDILLMCAGMELDGEFPALIARAHGEAARERPDFGLALAALPDAHWSALSPAAPLRHWRMVETGSGRSLIESPLRIDERILHFLAGVHCLDEQLEGYVQPLIADLEIIAPSHVALAGDIATAWSRIPANAMPAVVQLCGSDAAIKRAIASKVAASMGLNLYEMPAEVLPGTPQDLDVLIRLWQREAILRNGALLLDCENSDASDGQREALIRRFVDQPGGLLFVLSHERRHGIQRTSLTHEIGKPCQDEQYRLWQQALGGSAVRMNGQLSQLVSQFDLGPVAIREACTEAIDNCDDESNLDARLWNACRSAARPSLEDLAQRIEPVATWNELVLPDTQLHTLRAIAVHVRQRARVHDDWGFANRSSQGLGIAALFTGASGTGKTMAAEVLANELHLDLYRIDLSQVVSKYIGETEKNLRRVFDAAEAGGAILLFDEADALFGKRSEVKDSHDRYANIEVSYLLQRMESYRGLAILTTNLKNALDGAFLRRLRFVVQFPFPDKEQREAIWQRIYPTETPTDNLDWASLAKLNVAGGNIRNIALNAAFLAAEDDKSVGMRHVIASARLEYAKLERPLTELGLSGGSYES